MRRLAIILVLLQFVSCGQSSWTDFDGNKADLTHGSVSLMWVAPDCPLCQTYSTEFLKLSKSYPSVQFYGVLAGEHYSAVEIQHFIDSFGFDLPIVLDPNYELSKTYKVSVTPEFFLLSDGKVKYQGKFDNWATGLARKRTKPTRFYLEDALGAFTTGKEIENPFVTPLGCTLEYD